VTCDRSVIFSGTIRTFRTRNRYPFYKKPPAAFIIKKNIESFLACLAEDVGVCLFDGV
jgi:hypothetical protein